MSDFRESPIDAFTTADGNLTALIDVLQLASWQTQEISHTSISSVTVLMQRELESMGAAFENLQQEADADRARVKQYQSIAAIREERAKASRDRRKAVKS